MFRCVPVIYDGKNLGSPMQLLLSYCMLGAHLDSRREKLVALWLLTQCWHGRWQGGMESSSVRAGCSLQATSTEGDGAFTVNSGGWSLVCKLFHWDFLFASRLVVWLQQGTSSLSALCRILLIRENVCSCWTVRHEWDHSIVKTLAIFHWDEYSCLSQQSLCNCQLMFARLIATTAGFNKWTLCFFSLDIQHTHCMCDQFTLLF